SAFRKCSKTFNTLAIALGLCTSSSFQRLKRGYKFRKITQLQNTQLPDLFGSSSLYLQLFRCSGLGCRQTGGQHPIRRTRNIRQANPMAKLDRRRIASVLATNSDFESRIGTPSSLNTNLHQLAHAFLIQALKGIILQDSLAQICGQEGIDVIARKSVIGL